MPDSVSGPVTTALDRVRQGQVDAVSDLERALRPFLREQLQRVRRQIAGPLKPRIESEGIINAALKSFLSGVVKKEFPAMQNHEAAEKMLNTLISRTLEDEKDRHERRKRNPSREERSDATILPAKSFDLSTWIEDLLTVVGPVDPHALDIVQLLLEDLPIVEIARKLDLSSSSVKKIRRRMREAWEGEARSER